MSIITPEIEYVDHETFEANIDYNNSVQSPEFPTVEQMQTMVGGIMGALIRQTCCEAEASRQASTQPTAN